jgi:PAS domain S-box-containing protein
MRDGNLKSEYQDYLHTHESSHVIYNGYNDDLTGEQTEALIRSIDDLVFVLDAERNFVKCFQPESSNLLLSPALFLRKSLSAVPFPASVIKQMQQAFDAADETGTTQTIDYALLINEKVKWFSCKISKIEDGNKADGFIVVARDITEKVQFDEALRKSEVHYKMLADHILDLVGLHDVGGVFEYVSPSSLTVLGYTPEELVGKNAFELIHPDESAHLFENNRNKAAEGRNTFIDEFRIMHKNGDYIHFETTTKIIRNNDNEPVKFLSTSRDITEWKKAQHALMESEEKYRGLVENSDNIIAMIDKDCRYLFVNSRASIFIGAKPEHIVGKKLGEILQSGQESILIENIQKVITEERTIRSEHSLFVGGKQYWVRASYHPIRNSKGEVYAALLNAIDISNLKRTESLLAEQNKGLKEIAFLQSHVLRSPLANIKHLISLLDKKSLSEENKILFELLQVSADNLDDAIKQIVEKTYLSSE